MDVRMMVQGLAPGVENHGHAELGATIIALFDMAAERGRSAGRDGAHDAPLDAPEMTGVRLSKRCAMAAEDIRHLQSRSHDARSAGRDDLQAEPIKRARRVADRFGCD